jgi:phage terminase small subunit
MRKMPSDKQRLAAKLIMNGRSVTNAVREAGYSATTARVPAVVMRGKMFNQALYKEAENMNAIMSMMQAKVLAEGLDSLTVKETLQHMGTVANAMDKIYSMTGWKDKAKENDNDVLNLDDVLITDVEAQ